MSTENSPSARRTHLGIFLVFASTACWLSVFSVPFLVEQHAAWIAGTLYGLSYVLWLAAIPVLGKAWFVEQRTYWVNKFRRQEPPV